MSHKGKSLHESQWLINHARAVKNRVPNGKNEEGVVILEGSASMFWELQYGAVMVPEMVHAIHPTAKFVLMVRDPAERLYSDYIYFSYRTGAVLWVCVWHFLALFVRPKGRNRIPYLRCS